MLRDLLTAIQHKRAVVRLANDWASLVGPDVAKALAHHKLLEDAGTADYWPCPKQCGQVQNVEPYEGDGKPFIAGCSHEMGERGCEYAYLDEEQLEATGFSYNRFAIVLQKLLGMDVDLAKPYPHLPETVRLGRRTWGGVERDVLLSYGSSRENFGLFARLLQSEGKAALVLVPSLVGKNAEALLGAHAPGAGVEIQRLEDLLEVAGGELRLKAEFRMKDTAPTATAVPLVDAYCVVIERGKPQRMVSQVEYEQLVARANEFNLFVDAMGDGDARVICKNRPEAPKAELSPAEVLVVEKLLTLSKRFVVQHEVSKIKSDAVFRRARKAIDPKTDGDWTWVSCEKGDRPGVQFIAPTHVRCVLLRQPPKKSVA
jgi:hypothetical protein